MEHFNGDEAGVTAELYRGFVQNLFLYPLKSEEALRCKASKRSRRRKTANH